VPEKIPRISQKQVGTIPSAHALGLYFYLPCSTSQVHLQGNYLILLSLFFHSTRSICGQEKSMDLDGAAWIVVIDQGYTSGDFF
jgi:hypothetical protein